MTASAAARVALPVLALTTIGCDHVTKQAARLTLAGMPDRSFLADTLRLMYAENHGGFLSLGADWPPIVRTAVFTAATGLILVALIAIAIRKYADPWLAGGLTLFIAGGASNWLDRIVRGSVVDFLNVGIGPIRTGIFNLADVAIMIGVGIVVLREIRGRHRRRAAVLPEPSQDG